MVFPAHECDKLSSGHSQGGIHLKEVSSDEEGSTGSGSDSGPGSGPSGPAGSTSDAKKPKLRIVK